MDKPKVLGKSVVSENMFSGVTIGSIIAGALGLTFLMSTFDKRGRRK